MLLQDLICIPLTDGISYTYNNKTFLRSDNHMTWWSAENWCKAKGMTLVSLASTDINKDNLGNFFNSYEYCYGDGEERCKNVNWDALRTAFGSDNYWWTHDSCDSCPAFYVGIGYVDHDSRHGYFYALCE